MSDPQTAPTLAPPEIVLTPPQPVQKIEPERAGQMVKLAPDVMAKLDGEIDGFVAAVSALDPQSADFQKRVKAVYGAGDAEVAQSAAMSNRMLDKPMKSLESGAVSETSQVSKSLLDLRRLVEDLDPSKQGDLFQPRKLLGLIPFGNKLAHYFDRYTSAQGNIQRVIAALNNGRDELERDNASIEEEKVNLWGLMQRLEQYTYVLKGLDKKLDAKALELDGTDPAKAKVVREDVLFYVRQKTTDLLTQMAVNIQGYLALDMIRKTNLELIKGVQAGDHHHYQRVAYRRHGGAGAQQPETSAGSGDGPEHHHRQPDRKHLGAAENSRRWRCTSRRPAARSRSTS